MTIVQSLASFSLAAALLTITPGLDTVLVLRTAMADGRRAALLAGLGIATGLLCWGAVVAFGLGALLFTFPIAFTTLKWAGAAYLAVLGCRMILAPRGPPGPGTERAAATGNSVMVRRGLLTNLLNPKVGVFYLAFLPQFVPHGVDPGSFMMLLASVHAAMGIAWLGGVAAGAARLERFFFRASALRVLDRLTGGMFIAFGVRLALARS